ncbi:unnamed protein product [Mytilus edulis]|uniref:DUF6589 domain-containing protein n=1 Tax=Mytilus edulis TaxID=6550 RepID=A0A8S3U906_MYTED|nr:unnamed protein product [Mytilus edulis]
MLNKKKGFVSVLMEKDFKALETVKFEDVLIEFQEKFPELLDMIVAIMLPKDETSIANVVPRLAMIYGIIMQTRHHELSRMQRVVSMCLADNICDQSVYDRLNRIGVSTSYTVALSTINQLGKRYPDLLINAMKEGKYIRLVGDNVNFSVGTSHETKTNHKHMVHMFTSTALISDHHYLSKPKEPEIDLNQLSFEHILLQPQEYIIMRNDIINIQVITGSNADPNTKFQIGGDQLTRERLTQAMLLRYGNINPNDEFQNVGRCVAEFFHLGMNFLEKVIFAEMWNKKGLVEAGTLRGECERISRKGVDTNVMNAYEEDKKSSQNISLIFLTSNSSIDASLVSPRDVCDDQRDMGPCQVVKVTLANGIVLEIPMTTPEHDGNKENKPDKIKDYAHYGLEVGMTFIYFLQNVKNPERQKMLPLLKMMMIQLRGHSMNAKYPKEILRMLVQQYSVMGLQEACQVFQACFINTTGKSDGHVPADLVQEWNVKECKKHIKHMYSNKLDANICNRTSALPSIHTIADNFDTEACTIIRSKKHTRKQNDEDELLLIQDMKKIRPFEYTSGRSYKEFNTIPRSISQKVDGQLLLKWFNKNRRTFFI